MRPLLLARSLLMAVTMIGIVAATRFVAVPVISVTAPAAAEPASGVTPAPLPRMDPAELAQQISSRDLFRAARAPATARFDPSRGDQTIAIPPPTSRPQLVLAGILTGSDPAALLEGLPGFEGTRVMRAGERAGAYLVRAIRGDEVIVVGLDTTWTLRVRTRFP